MRAAFQNRLREIQNEEEEDQESSPVDEDIYYRAEDLYKPGVDECFEISIPGASWTELCDCNSGKSKAALSDFIPVGEKPSKIRLSLSSRSYENSPLMEYSNNELMTTSYPNLHEPSPNLLDVEQVGLFELLEREKDKMDKHLRLFDSVWTPKQLSKPVNPRVAWSEPNRKLTGNVPWNNRQSPLRQRSDTETSELVKFKHKELQVDMDGVMNLNSNDVFKTPVLPLHLGSNQEWHTLSDDEF